MRNGGGGKSGSKELLIGRHLRYRLQNRGDCLHGCRIGSQLGDNHFYLI